MFYDRTQKLEVLTHYWQYNDISLTSRMFGVSRQTIYNWLHRYDPTNPSSLDDLSRAHHSHSQATPPETVAHILQLARRNPTLGGTEIAKLVAPPHACVSAQTINAMLAKNDVSTPDQRWAELQRQLHGRESVAMGLAAPLRAFVLGRNARYRDWDFCGKRPGDGVAIGQVSLGNLNGVGSVWLSCAVDSYCCLAFGRIHVGRPATALKDVLGKAVGFFNAHHLALERARVHQKPWVTKEGAIQFAKALNGHKIRLAGLFDGNWPPGFGPSPAAQLIANQQASGLVEQFVSDLQIGWLDGLDRRRHFDIDELASEFDGWLSEYNQSTEICGYPNYGLSPMAALQRWQGAN